MTVSSFFLWGGTMEEITFKERVKNIAISQSKDYKKIYVDYEYLICSSAFTRKDYYIIDAKEDNYQHLIGVNSLIKAGDFFEKCYCGTLTQDDFNFIKRNQSEKSVIGSVRRKIKVLPNIMDLFYNQSGTKVEENFVKNQISCNFATSDNKCTLGFVDNKKSRPKTLVKGNELNKSKMREIDLVLRKNSGASKFDKIIIGDITELNKYYDKVKDHLSDELLQKIILPKECDNVEKVLVDDE